MGVSKVVYNGNSLIDLTADTVTADNLVSGVTAHDMSGNLIVGTLVPGSSGKNIQCYEGYATVNTTSYTATSVSLTVDKTGTYNVSWMGYRNRNSGTSGSQLYIDGKAYGSANTSFSNTYGQSVKLTNVSLTKGQVLVIRARASSTSYVMGVGNLCIVEQ